MQEFSLMREGEFTMRIMSHANKIRGCAFLALTATLASSSHGAVGDNVLTEKRIISQVLVATGSGGAIYYLRADDGWGASGCSGAIYGYISESVPGAAAALSTALAARATGKPVSFSGVCGDTAGNGEYIKIGTLFY
jgi:hypothetical protein